MRCLVTGATGFIGRALCKALLNEGHDVVAVIHEKPLGIKGCIEEKLDITNPARFEDVVRRHKIDGIFHLAAVAHDVIQPDEYENLIKTNVNGTLVAVASAVRGGAKNFIYSSTMSVYGKPLYVPVDEEHETKPTNAYGYSKLFGEQLCNMFSDKINLTILRYSSVYGPGQEPQKAVPIFIKNALSGKPIELAGDGSQSSDFVFVEDVAQANIKAIGKKGVFNIGSGKETTIKKLAETIIRLTNSKSKITSGHEISDRHFRFYYSIEKAKQYLRFKPTPLEQGIQKQIEDLK